MIAALVKIGIALMTLGTNDAIAFYQFAKAMETHGLSWTYEHSALFNHPPLVGYFLQGLAWLDHQSFFIQNGLTFPFLLRLPGIIADFFWMERRRWHLFTASFVVSTLLFCAEPLLRSPVMFAKNVLSYGSFWGVWGLTYCLRMTGLQEFSKVSFFNLSGAQNAIIMILKVIVVLGILLLAWRRRKLAPPALFASVASAWMIFFVFSPGVAAQYLVWLGPFILLLCPTFFAFLTAGSSIFLFALYTITSGGFPWYFAHASNKLNAICAHWALVPWLTLAGGLFAFALNARRQNPNLRFVNLTTIEPNQAP